MADYPTMWNGPGATPPAGSAAPQPDAPAPSEAQVGVRPVADVVGLLANMRRAEATGYQLEEFHEGVRAAYVWAVGDGRAPVTERAAGAPDARQLRVEDDAAEEAMRGPRRLYASGVQHAVMWLRGATDDQPWTVWEA